MAEILRKLAGRLEIKNADERRQVKTRQAVLHGADFKALWDRIKHKTTYRVQFDNEKLLLTCIKALADGPPIAKSRLQWRMPLRCSPGFRCCLILTMSASTQFLKCLRGLFRLSIKTHRDTPSSLSIRRGYCPPPPIISAPKCFGAAPLAPAPASHASIPKKL
ncbi:MAG TPA: hypothetical protein VGM54_12735 [Chthoniobacter sp.]|jgi:hypothetical protein